MRLAGFVLLVLACLSMSGYALVAYSILPAGSTVHPSMMATYSVERVGILTHVFASSLTLLLGPWQFSAGLRRSRPRLHRAMGRVYLGLGVLPGGVAGLYMAFHAFGGWVSYSGFAVLAGLWLLTGWRAYSAARRRDFGRHRAWMIRNFALALAAVTLRAQLGACAATGWAFESFYPLLAWSSWVPNALAAEWVIARTGRSASVGPAAARPAADTIGPPLRGDAR